MTGKKPTGRTKQLSLKSTPKFHQKLKELAVKEKRLMIENLEQSLELYEREKKLRKKPVKENRENIQPEVTQTNRNKRSRDDDVIESPDPSSKKRKIDNY
jgi:hypothetical protein